MSWMIWGALWLRNPPNSYGMGHGDGWKTLKLPYDWEKNHESTTLGYLGYQGFDPYDSGKMEDIIDKCWLWNLGYTTWFIGVIIHNWTPVFETDWMDSSAMIFPSKHIENSMKIMNYEMSSVFPCFSHWNLYFVQECCMFDYQRVDWAMRCTKHALVDMVDMVGQRVMDWSKWLL